jgi:hypothetical protein
MDSSPNGTALALRNFLLARLAPETYEPLSVPDWLECDPTEPRAKVTGSPHAASVPFDLDVQLVVEYYARFFRLARPRADGIGSLQPFSKPSPRIGPGWGLEGRRNRSEPLFGSAQPDCRGWAGVPRRVPGLEDRHEDADRGRTLSHGPGGRA